MASHTVENYLKAIIQAQHALEDPKGLVSMGHLAASLGVVPGTATAMVKTLADSGLLVYEPYVGVRLTPAGEKLAGLVLRRHRLIELFLVKVMGMNWTEVHDEAEHLEHAVSERLIERIDEMLGRPEVDPHGDPIPGPKGTVRHVAYDTLLTCALNEPVSVTRVADQDREFLEFVERHDLMPGQVVRVETRDAAADSVRLRAGGHRRITIGARAASKVLVTAAHALLIGVLLAGSVRAQSPAPPGPDFGISDNSFLVEEAFNQEPGIFQNIFGWMRQAGDWAFTFTQEWPAPGTRHQLSYTIPVQSLDGRVGAGDLYLHYRLQALAETGRHPAFSPRVSVVVPSGTAKAGAGRAGLQVNLPFSRRIRRVYVHWNAGVTWLPRGGRPDLLSPVYAVSAIYRARRQVHLMLESVLAFDDAEHEPGRAARVRTFTISPGLRRGWNMDEKQLVIGGAVPVASSGGRTAVGALAYVSFEGPFRRAR